jgi:acetylglutamate kinase
MNAGVLSFEDLRIYRDSQFVVKIGGELLKDAPVIEGFASDISLLRDAGISLVIVHGGGPQLEGWADRLGIGSTTVNGRRVTDTETLELAKMVFAGRISTDLVAALRRQGVPGVGLSGVDGNLIDATRRPPRWMIDRESGERELVDFQNVGDVRRVDRELLGHLLDRQFVPVISPLGADLDGNVFNINADTVASEIAISLRADKLLVLSDVPGILRDREDRNSRIAEVTLDAIQALIEAGVVRGGMIPKLTTMVRALEGGTRSAHLIDGQSPHALLREACEPGSQGTLVLPVSGRPVSVLEGSL